MRYYVSSLHRGIVDANKCLGEYENKERVKNQCDLLGNVVEGLTKYKDQRGGEEAKKTVLEKTKSLSLYSKSNIDPQIYTLLLYVQGLPNDSQYKGIALKSIKAEFKLYQGKDVNFVDSANEWWALYELLAYHHWDQHHKFMSHGRINGYEYIWGLCKKLIKQQLSYPDKRHTSYEMSSETYTQVRTNLFVIRNACRIFSILNRSKEVGELSELKSFIRSLIPTTSQVDEVKRHVYHIGIYLEAMSDCVRVFGDSRNFEDRRLKSLGSSNLYYLYRQHMTKTNVGLAVSIMAYLGLTPEHIVPKKDLFEKIYEVVKLWVSGS